MANDSNTVNDTITVMGKDIPVTRTTLRQDQLRFYPENPRVYSLLWAGEEEPPQDEIERRLTKMDHVKQLVQSIRANGGLIDPLLVKGGDKVVLEGNSRLAAYRLLARGNPVKWGRVRCVVLPNDVDEDTVFALLGEYHIIGRKDWAPFEQAGYLWRRSTRHKIEPSDMAKEMGLSVNAVNHMINVYQFMVDHQEVDVQKWSYYDEYLKSNKIKRVRRLLPELDDTVVKQVGSGEISKAADIREKLACVCKAREGNLVRRFAKGRQTLDQAYEEAKEGGADSVLYNRLRRFREQISDTEVRLRVKELPTKARNKCKFELEKICKRTKQLLDDLS